MTTTRPATMRATVVLALAVMVGLGGAARPAQADKQQKIIDKMIQLNKKAMDDFDTAEFAAAKALLLEAATIGNNAGLANHPIMARTYVHLGALSAMGYQDQRTAQAYFLKALDIQADIEPEKTFRSGSVGPLFEKVRRRKLAAAAAPSGTRPSSGSEDSSSDSAEAGGGLECANPDSTPPDVPVILRCAPAVSPDVAAVDLHYKGQGMKGFEAVPMEKSPEGSFQATVPAKRVRGRSLQFYFEGLDASENPVGASGGAKDPHRMAIIDPAHARRSDGGSGDREAPVDASPVEWSVWIGGGGGERDIGTRRNRRAVFAPRAGAGLSFRLSAFADSAYELRWGPWLMGETQLDGVLGEGGLALMFVPVRAARAAYELRAGGGFFKDRLSGSGELSVTLTCGTRLVAPRGLSPASSDAGDTDDSKVDAESARASAGAAPDKVAFANGVRLFVEARTVPVRGRGITVIGGLEITPSLFFPPYTSERWVGGGPQEDVAGE